MSSNVHPLQKEIHLHQPVLLPGIRSPSKTYIIYFITGNPGLIEYYRSFLTQLYGLLSSSDSSTRFHVYGRSLSGFEVETPTSRGSANTKPPPYSLDEQIEQSEATLRDLVDDVRKEADEANEPRVILMGHSVGAYILLEITRRLAGINGSGRSVQIAGGVCLFPTVTHIMRSENGRKSSVRSSVAVPTAKRLLRANSSCHPHPTDLLTLRPVASHHDPIRLSGFSRRQTSHSTNIRCVSRNTCKKCYGVSFGRRSRDCFLHQKR